MSPFFHWKLIDLIFVRKNISLRLPFIRVKRFCPLLLDESALFHTEKKIIIPIFSHQKSCPPYLSVNPARASHKFCSWKICSVGQLLVAFNCRNIIVRLPVCLWVGCISNIKEIGKILLPWRWTQFSKMIGNSSVLKKKILQPYWT